MHKEQSLWSQRADPSNDCGLKPESRLESLFEYMQMKNFSLVFLQRFMLWLMAKAQKGGCTHKKQFLSKPFLVNANFMSSF